MHGICAVNHPLIKPPCAGRRLPGNRPAKRQPQASVTKADLWFTPQTNPHNSIPAPSSLAVYINIGALRHHVV